MFAIQKGTPRLKMLSIAVKVVFEISAWNGTQPLINATLKDKDNLIPSIIEQ